MLYILFLIFNVASISAQERLPKDGESLITIESELQPCTVYLNDKKITDLEEKTWSYVISNGEYTLELRKGDLSIEIQFEANSNHITFSHTRGVVERGTVGSFGNLKIKNNSDISSNEDFAKQNNKSLMTIESKDSSDEFYLDGKIIEKFRGKGDFMIKNGMHKLRVNSGHTYEFEVQNEHIYFKFPSTVVEMTGKNDL